jgi:hypothetical protein
MFGCRTIRMICSSRFCQSIISHCTRPDSSRDERRAYLESLVLENSFDRRIFAVRGQFGLKHYSKAAIPNDLALCVLHFLCLARDAILDFLSDDFCEDIQLLH